MSREKLAKHLQETMLPEWCDEVTKGPLTWLVPKAGGPTFLINTLDQTLYRPGDASIVDAVTVMSELRGITEEAIISETTERMQQDPVIEERTRMVKFLTEVNRRTADFWHTMLTEQSAGAKARAYLKDRGVHESSISTFSVGYAPRMGEELYHNVRTLAAHHFPEKNAEEVTNITAQTGLFSQRVPTRCLFSERIIFPITNSQGHVVGFGGRHMDPDNGPKYLNSPETLVYRKKERLFGIAAATPYLSSGTPAVIAEGYMDVIAFHQAGIRSAVAPCGTALTRHQVRGLKAYTDELIIALDMDQAGIDATKRALLVAHEEGLPVRGMVALPHKDASATLEAQGPGALVHAVRHPTPPLTWLSNREASGRELSSVRGKASYVQALSSWYGMFQEALVAEAERVTGISPGPIREDLKKWSASTSRHYGEKIVREQEVFIEALEARPHASTHSMDHGTYQRLFAVSKGDVNVAIEAMAELLPPPLPPREFSLNGETVEHLRAVHPDWDDFAEGNGLAYLGLCAEEAKSNGTPWDVHTGLLRATEAAGIWLEQQYAKAEDQFIAAGDPTARKQLVEHAHEEYQGVQRQAHFTKAWTLQGEAKALWHEVKTHMHIRGNDTYDQALSRVGLARAFADRGVEGLLPYFHRDHIEGTNSLVRLAQLDGAKYDTRFPKVAVFQAAMELEDPAKYEERELALVVYKRHIERQPEFAIQESTATTKDLLTAVAKTVLGPQAHDVGMLEEKTKELHTYLQSHIPASTAATSAPKATSARER